MNLENFIIIICAVCVIAGPLIIRYCEDHTYLKYQK